LEILWLTQHNPEINWRIEKVKMTKCVETRVGKSKMKKKEKERERAEERRKEE